MMTVYLSFNDVSILGSFLLRLIELSDNEMEEYIKEFVIMADFQAPHLFEFITHQLAVMPSSYQFIFASICEKAQLYSQVSILPHKYTYVDRYVCLFLYAHIGYAIL